MLLVIITKKKEREVFPPFGSYWYAEGQNDRMFAKCEGGFTMFETILISTIAVLAISFIFFAAGADGEEVENQLPEENMEQPAQNPFEDKAA